MEKKKKNVKGMSVVFFLTAAFDLYCVVCTIMILNGNYFEPDFLGLDVTMGKSVFVATMVMYALDLICRAYLGVKGLQVVKGTYQGKKHVQIAFVLFVIELIGIGATGFLVIQGNFHLISQMLLDLITCFLLYFYREFCKEIAK